MYTGVLVLVFISLTTGNALPLSRAKSIFISPDSLRYYADYIDNSVSIGDTVIQVGAGEGEEKLIQVPLAAAGELDAKVSIRLTVGFDDDLVTTDNDIIVGITDGSVSNQFYISDPSTDRVCGPFNNVGGTHEGNTASEGSLYYPGQVTIIFQPFFKYGACYTAHDGGFVNVARFNSMLDPTKGLSLVVHRDNEADEQYRIYYFIVEIL